MNNSRRFAIVAAGFLAAILLFSVVAAAFAAASFNPAAGGDVRYVAPAGDDTANDCLDPDLPCQTVQHAVDQAVDSDQVYIAAGDYVENIVITKEVALLGGFEAGSWARDPHLFVSTLDGSGGQLVPGDWDGAAVLKVAVISDTGEFKMWYDGQDIFGQYGVGLATSPGITGWVKHPANPLFTGDPGEWDEFGEHAPFVLKEGGTYKMWYEGNNGTVRQLGYATSPDGITWTKFGANPVLEAGPEPYDQDTAGHGSVLAEGGGYKLWYHAIGDQGPIIAYATSPNGTNWTKQGPVLLPEAGGWDEFALWGPSVVYEGGLYWMWYSALGPGWLPSIGVVTSTNGISWTRFLTGPVLADTEAIGDPHVIYDSGLFRMWYQNFKQGRIYYAESADGINWSPAPFNPVLEPGLLFTDPGRPVVTVLAANVTLDGLTMRNGFAEWTGGVGVSIPGDDDFTLFNCRVENNRAVGEGAGGGLSGNGHILIENSRFTDNAYVTILTPGEPGAAGAIRTGEGMLTIVNSLIAGNGGDAAIHTNNSLALMNVTLAHNAANIIFNPQPDPGILTIQNSIIYFNEFGFLNCPAGSTCDVTYSDIEGGWAGTGNIEADPLFAADGWHLASGSPAMDTGSNTNAPLDDLEFDPRPVDGNLDGMAITDMGADEFMLWLTHLPVALNN